MYNLLITFQAGAWDSRTYEFRRERFCQLEYTKEVIRSQFLALTPETILKLQALPALFAYEGRTSDVRVGYLRRIVDYPGRGTVFIEFDFEWDLPPIPFARIEPLRLALGLGDVWELSTTHWAVKDVDLLRVLKSAGFTLGAGAGSQQAAALAVQPRGATLAREAEVELLLAALRRLGEGGLRSLITRRRGRSGIAIIDEYDMQDAVEALLRTLYLDVRPEEPTPSSAGSHSRIDMQVRSQKLAVEVKVTASGRAERAIKDEIVRDIHDYQSHPYVRIVVIAVYDLAGTFTNASGFENDLSRRYNDVEVVVLVVPWVGPR